MTRRRYSVLVCAVGLSAACGPTQQVPPPVGSGGSGTGTGTSGSGSSGESGDSDTGSTSAMEEGSGSAGEAESEGESDDSGDGYVFDVELFPPDMEQPDACWPTETSLFTIQGSLAPDACGTMSFEGRVLGATDTTLSVDACPCDSDCFVEDPQDFVLETPDGHAPFWSAEVGRCVQVTAVPAGCDGTRLVLIETEPEHPECELVMHYSHRYGGMDLDWADTWPHANAALGDSLDVCMGDEIELETWSVEGQVLGLNYAVADGDELFTQSCFADIVELWDYQVSALSARGWIGAGVSSWKLEVEVLMTRSLTTVLPP